MPTHTPLPTPARGRRASLCARGAAALLAAGLAAFASVARAEPVRLAPGAAGRVDLAPAMTVARDPSGAWTLEDARAAAGAARFAPLAAEGLGYVRGAVWARVALENASDAPGSWVVTFDFPLLESLDAWVVRAGVPVEHVRGGIAVPPSERGIVHRGLFHEWRLALGARERVEVLVRVESRGSMVLRAAVQDPETLVRTRLPVLALQGANVGILLCLVLLNLYWFAALRDRSHLHAALLMAALGGYAVSVTGLAAALGPGWTPRWTMVAPTAFAAGACWVAIRFARRFLGIEALGSGLDRARHVAWAALPVAGLLVLDLRAANAGGAALVTVTVAVLVTWAAASWRAGYRPARFFVAATVGFTWPVLAFVATVLGLLPPRGSTVAALQLGFSYAGVVFAFALADRVRTADRRAKEALEAAVRDRTRQLEDSVYALRREAEERRRAECARRDTEEKLRRSQRVEAVGRLAGGVAHDYNNLLTSISTNVGYLLLDLAPDDPRRTVLEDVSTAVDRGAALTRQLLALGRRQAVEPRVLAVNDVLENLRRLLARLLDGIDLRLDLEPTAEPVLADHGQVEQVVMNLVLNARDALPSGGRISLRTRTVDVRPGAEPRPGAHAGRYVVIEVADTGTGIPPDVARHLFEPFFTTKTEGQGSGLGLATVHGIVEAHGGFIEVEPNPGRGAVFRVHLPVAAQGAASDVAARAVAPLALPGGTERILLVEDEHVVREGTQRLLERLGYFVVAARDGAEATRLAETQGPFDLLLANVVLGDGSGHALGLRLAARMPGLRVLLASGHAQDVLGDAAVATGDVHFVAKPFTPAALAGRVRAALDGAATGERRRGAA